MMSPDDEARPSFELSKWYLDCVGEGGDVFIAYAAEVRWRAHALRYTSTLVQRAGSATRVEATLRDMTSVAVAVVFGLLTWLGAGVDFPDANRRFARLV